LCNIETRRVNQGSRCNHKAFNESARHQGQLMDMKIKRTGSFTLCGNPAKVDSYQQKGYNFSGTCSVISKPTALSNSSSLTFLSRITPLPSSA